MRLHAAYSPAPAYLYLFSHRGQRSMTDLQELHSQQPGRGSAGDFGVVQGDELLHLFPNNHVLPAGGEDDPEDPEDRKVSDLLIDVLLTFAKTG